MCTFSYLEKYQTFNSKKEMDEHVKLHTNFNRDVLKPSTIKVLRHIAGSCLTYFGATRLRIDTMAKKLELSERTVLRATKLLSECGVIEKYKTTNQKGQGASIFSILPFSKNSNVSHRSAKTCQSLNDKKVEVNVTDSKVEEVSNESLNKELNSFSLTSFKTSTINNIYTHAYAHEEFLNEFQITLIELLNSFQIDKILGEEMIKVVQATEINSAKDFHFVKDIIFNLAKDIQSGRLSVDTTLRAVYKAAYNKKLERSMAEIKNAPEEIVEAYKRPVPFYNWLEQR